MKAKLALQLWSVKKAFMEDYKQTLEKIAELGFAGVEFAGYRRLEGAELDLFKNEGANVLKQIPAEKFINIPAEDIKAALEENNLVACGAHVQLDDIVNELDEVIAYNKIVGNSYIICPFAAVDEREKLDDLIAKLNIASAKLKANGMVLGYHNHNHEFIEYDGKFALDIIFENVQEICPQVDTYWVFRAGQNFTDYCKKYTGKFVSLHLKDGTTEKGTTLGEGEVNLPAVISLADEVGAKWLVMEDETHTGDEFTSIEKGMKNLNLLLK